MSNTSPSTDASSPGLVVPIDVDALCLRSEDVAEDNPLLKPFAQFEELHLDGLQYDVPLTSRTARVAPTPSTDSDSTSTRVYDPGIYLHWALPDALTHGTVQTDDNTEDDNATARGQTALPPVPNRWLVVRTVVTPGADAPATHRQAWVVESDYMATQAPTDPDRKKQPDVEQPTSTVPLSPETAGHLLNDPSPYAYLGRAVPFEKWNQPTDASAPEFQESTYPKPLTVMGYGETAWSATYANASAALGFYEPKESLPDDFDPETQALQYAVVGWYDDRSNDPADGATAEEVLKAHDWALDEAPADRPDSFAYSLYHGTVQDLDWNAEAGDPDVPETGDLTLSIGNTSAEALSALAAHEGAKTNGANQTGSPPDEQIKHLEFWLNALQLGLLGTRDLSAIWDLEALRQEIHSGSFSVQGGGITWTVRPATDASGGETSGRDPLAGALQKMSSDQVRLLRDLNDAQRRYNRQTDALQSERFQAYADWWHYMEAKVLGAPSGPAPSGLYSEMYEQLEGGGGDAGKYSLFLQSDRLEKLRPVYLTSSNPDARAEGGETASGQNEPPIKSATGSKQKALDGLRRSIAQKKQALDHSLAQAGLSLHVVRTSAPSFYRPCDPVIMLKGDVANPTDRHGKDGKHRADDCLQCRLTSSLVTKIAFDGSSPVETNRSQMPDAPTGGPLPSDAAPAIGSLVNESLLLDPAAAPLYAATASKDEAESLESALKQLATSGSSPDSLTVAGTAPSPVGATVWSPPWHPIMLEWRVTVHPFQTIKGPSTDYDPTLVTRNFAFEDADLGVRDDPAKQPSKNDHVYKGRVVLTPGARSTLQEQIQNIPHLADHPKLKKKLSTLSNTPILSQSLGGFHEWMLMKHQVFQLNTIDPGQPPRAMNRLREAIGTQTPEKGTDRTVDDVSPANTHAPAPDHWYNPIRASVAEVTHLRVVDAFGQTCEIDLTKNRKSTRVAQSLQAPESVKLDPATHPGASVFLRPRLCQASRLNVNWLSVDGTREVGSDPASSPICGWVVPIYLTDGVMVFSESGEPLGTMYVVQKSDTPTVVWQNAPLSGDASTAVGDDASAQAKSILKDAGVNESLTEYVTTILDTGGAYLQGLMKATKQVHATVDPGEHNEAPIESLVMGQPLALARARVSMELKGRRALNQSYEAVLDHLKDSYTDHGTEAQPYGERSSNQFENVRFPVKLGSLGRHYDGLVGYFADGDYSSFHTLVADEIDAPNVKPSTGAGALTVTPSSATTGEAAEGTDSSGENDPSTRPRPVTLLMDPRSTVHATTGIQPVSALDLAPRHFQPILRKLNVTVLSAPILSGPTPGAAGDSAGDGASNSKGNFGLPLPATKEGRWSWVEPQRSGDAVDWAQTSTADIHSVSDKHSRSYADLGAREGWLFYTREDRDS